MGAELALEVQRASNDFKDAHHTSRGESVNGLFARAHKAEPVIPDTGTPARRPSPPRRVSSLAGRLMPTTQTVQPTQGTLTGLAGAGGTRPCLVCCIC